ncbi:MULTISPECIES: hypothetical protein [Planktothricoides]|uniref:Uncharacterized protein n=2 Tax=Planktothricoides raciborskii TaxID=132608 RepID=A0AAU8JLD1_9CYAN|nr:MULTISPECIES: hypothetical protein [Planktothricoides]MBD2547292.1 hypothetical protein [Planktothricoides raciborskii FACHB-1370]MBD2585814.1 hypothetical protein [Planktothricoides raciborskii FACHB-1261]
MVNFSCFWQILQVSGQWSSWSAIAISSHHLNRDRLINKIGAAANWEGAVGNLGS